MAIASSSKIYSGTLKLGPTASALDFSCKPTAIAINPPDPPDEALDEVLCGDKVEPEDVEISYGTMTFTALQDFDDADGLVAYSWDPLVRGTFVEYEWRTSPTGVTVTGTVRVWPLTMGGDVGRGKRLTADAEWNLGEEPTFTRGNPVMTAEPEAERRSDELVYETT